MNRIRRFEWISEELEGIEVIEALVRFLGLFCCVMMKLEENDLKTSKVKKFRVLL